MLMRVLVTGGNGFLGRHVINAFHERRVPGAELYCGCRDGNQASSSPYAPMFPLGDLSDFDTDNVDFSGFDAIIHCAGVAHGSSRGEKNSDVSSLMEEVNVGGTLRVARHAARAGVKRFVFVSSVGVLGNQNVQPFDNKSALAPVENYAESKRLAEVELRKLSLETGMQLVIVRPPMIYGPHAPGNFRTLVKLLKTGLPIPLAGIDNLKSFVSVWNVSDLLVEVCLSSKAVGHTFLVRDGEDISTSEFLVEVSSAYGIPCRLFWLPLVVLRFGAVVAGKSDMFGRIFGSLRIDDSSTREILDWEPPLSLRASLSKCAQYEGRG